jgi:hypothetical protein
MVVVDITDVTAGVIIDATDVLALTTVVALL